MKYLGIDYGLKKVGLAISEGQIASIYLVLPVASLVDAVAKVTNVIKKEEINRVVVGVPEAETGKVVKKFVGMLKLKLTDSAVEVIEADETLSSKTAVDLMINLGTSKKDRRREDAYSAAIILQNFLDSLE